MRIFIIRHGDPDYQTDSLTPRGRREAEALAAYIERLQLTHIYCSPLGRAQQTCRPCAEKLGLPVETLSWTRELTGVYYELDGFGRLSPFFTPGEVMYSISPTPRYAGWQNQKYFDDPRYYPLVKEMQAGSDALLARHGYVHEGALYKIERPSEDRIAVFCHQGLGTTWISYLLNIPYQAAWAGMWQACTGITCIRMECRSTRFSVPRMLYMGDTTHIELAGLEKTERGLSASMTAC